MCTFTNLDDPVISSNFGEIKLKATSANSENLFTKVEEKEKFYFQVSIKPECDMNHRQSAKEIADIEISPFI